MKKLILAASAALAIAGMGHNMSPLTISPSPTAATNNQAVLSRRIVDENRRNQKLKQRLRRAKRIQRLQKYNRFQRKTMKFGQGYRPGKLFKGHRI